MIIVAGIILYVLSGGFPPTSWILLIQVLSQWSAISAARSGVALLSLVILIFQSLLFAVAWGLFIWVIAREFSAHKELQTQISLAEKQAMLRADASPQSVPSAAVVSPELQAATLPFVPGALREEPAMPPLQSPRAAAAPQRQDMPSNPFEMQPQARPGAAQQPSPQRQVPAAASRKQDMSSNPFEMQPQARPGAAQQSSPQRQVPAAASRKLEMPSNPFEMQSNLQVSQKPVTRNAPSGGLRYVPTADEIIEDSPFGMSSAREEQKTGDDQVLATAQASVPVEDKEKRKSGGLRYSPENEREQVQSAKGSTAETPDQQQASPFDEVPKSAERRSGGLRMQRTQHLRRGKNDPFAVVPDVFELFQEEQNNQKMQNQQENDAAGIPVRNADNLGEEEFYMATRLKENSPRYLTTIKI